MTEENRKRRQFLLDIEGIVRETLASQPMEDDCVRCGMTLDRGLVRVEEVVQKYKAEWPEHWAPPARGTTSANAKGCSLAKDSND